MDNVDNLVHTQEAVGVSATDYIADFAVDEAGADDPGFDSIFVAAYQDLPPQLVDGVVASTGRT